MQRVVGIDVGSNAIRMVVAQLNAKDQVEILENVRIPVRLGEDAFTIGRLSEPSMQTALDAFIRFHQIAKQFEVKQIRAVATSAMREAENRAILIKRIAQHTGIRLELISGEEEARLIHLAVAKEVDLRHKKAMLVDIGGGSIEVTISEDNKIVSAESYAIGALRLLHHLNESVGDQSFATILREYIGSALLLIKHDIGSRKLDLCIGTGGNLEELGNLRKRVFKEGNNRLIKVNELRNLSKKMSEMSVDERIRKYNLRPDRADVILPAAMVMNLIAREVHVKEIQIPGASLKDGLLWDMAPLTRGPGLPLREQVWASAHHLGEKYQFDAEHGEQVAKIARRLFEQTRSLHSLDTDDEALLEVACLLHDTGQFINTIDHDKHGYYIVKSSPLIGLTNRQQEIVASVIRFHRKTAPTTQDDNFKLLPPKDRIVVNKLCALLRLADAIGVSHTTRVHDVTMREGKRSWQLILHGEGNLLLERWKLEKGKTLFEEIFGVQLEIRE